MFKTNICIVKKSRVNLQFTKDFICYSDVET
jgi:hypothetical protein